MKHMFGGTLLTRGYPCIVGVPRTSSCRWSIIVVEIRTVPPERSLPPRTKHQACFSDDFEGFIHIMCHNVLHLTHGDGRFPLLQHLARFPNHSGAVDVVHNFRRLPAQLSLGEFSTWAACACRFAIDHTSQGIITFT